MPRRNTRRKIGSVWRCLRISRRRRHAVSGRIRSWRSSISVAAHHIVASIEVATTRPATRSEYDGFTACKTSYATDLCSSSSAACHSSS